MPRPGRAGASAPERGGPYGRELAGGVVFDGAEEPIDPALLAPWWGPDPELFAVLVRLQPGAARFQVGEGQLGPLSLARLVALSSWDGQPVLLITGELPPDGVVQLIADALQAPVIAGPQRHRRWWAARPRRADGAGAPVADMGGSYPFQPAGKAALAAPTALSAAARSRSRRRRPPVAEDSDERGVLLARSMDAGYQALVRRLDGWRRQPDRGQFAAVVRVDARDPDTPYRMGGRPATSWDVAVAIAAARAQWAVAGRELVLLADPAARGPHRQLQLLASYLQVPVTGPEAPLWTSDLDSRAAVPVLRRRRRGGRLTPGFADPPGDGWVRVAPLPAGGQDPGARAALPAAPDGPDSRGVARVGVLPTPADPRLADVFAASVPTPAGRRFGQPPDPAVRRALDLVPGRRDRYVIEVDSDAAGYLADGERLTAGDLAVLVGAAPGMPARPLLLLGVETGAGGQRDEAPAAQDLADELDSAVLVPAAPAYVSRDGLLVLGPVLVYEPDADLPYPVRLSGVGYARLRPLPPRAGVPGTATAPVPVERIPNPARTVAGPPPGPSGEPPAAVQPAPADWVIGPQVWETTPAGRLPLAVALPPSPPQWFDAAPLAESPLAEPRLAEPRLAEPRLAEPRLAEPRLAEPQLAESPLAESPLAESPPAGPQPAGTLSGGVRPVGPPPAVSPAPASPVGPLVGPPVASPSVGPPPVGPPPVRARQVAPSSVAPPPLAMPLPASPPPVAPPPGVPSSAAPPSATPGALGVRSDPPPGTPPVAAVPGLPLIWSGQPPGVLSPHRIGASYRSSPEERRQVRATLDWRYDVHARSITRTLASRPGMRAAGAGETEDALVGDLIAVRAYVSRDGLDVDAALRSPDPSPVLATAGCIASGLRRLPSYRGPVYRRARLPSMPAAYVAGALLVEPAFVSASPAPDAEAPGETLFVVWSATGRRTASIEPDGPDEILFAPNSAFKVLDVRPPNGSGPCVLLRELQPWASGPARAGPLTEEDETLLERLRQARAGQPQGGTARDIGAFRQAFPIGLDDRGRPFVPPVDH